MVTADELEPFPPVPLESWRDTKETLHRFAQVVGKVRLAHSPRRNHWWNVPFHLTGRGLTTRPMGGPMGGAPVFAVDLDLVDHRLEVVADTGTRAGFALAGHSVATFTAAFDDALAAVGTRARIGDATPFDLPDAHRRFRDDVEHASYDPAAVTRYWRVLGRVNLLLEEFAGSWSGKTSPVHHFWHTFDIAVTRFGTAVVDQPSTAGAVTREAYSRDVISSGFWFGDDTVPEPAFYSYTAPEPAGLADQPLRPATATWTDRGTTHLALLRYDDVRTLPDPRATVLEFYDSAFRAGADLAGWDRSLESPGGVTDPRPASARQR